MNAKQRRKVRRACDRHVSRMWEFRRAMDEMSRARMNLAHEAFELMAMAERAAQHREQEP